jgi:hypothetical protein
MWIDALEIIWFLWLSPEIISSWEPDLATEDALHGKEDNSRGKLK